MRIDKTRVWEYSIDGVHWMPVPEAMLPKLNTPISYIKEQPGGKSGVRVRTFNCLYYVGVNDFGDLVQMTPEQLINVRNFGKDCLALVKDVVFDMGLWLGMKLRRTEISNIVEGSVVVPLDKFMKDLEGWVEAYFSEKH